MNAQFSSARSFAHVPRGRAKKPNFHLQHSLHFQRDFLYELRFFKLLWRIPFFDVVVFLPRRDRDGGGGGSERDTLPPGSTRKEEERGKGKRELSPAGSTHNFLRCLIRGRRRRMASYVRSGGEASGGAMLFDSCFVASSAEA